MKIIDGKLVVCVIVESREDDIGAKDGELTAKGYTPFEAEEIDDEFWIWYVHRDGLQKQAPLTLEEKYATIYQRLTFDPYDNVVKVPLDKKRVILLNKEYTRIRVAVPNDISVPIMPYMDWLAWVVAEFEKEGARTLIIPKVAGEIEVVEIDDTESEITV